MLRVVRGRMALVISQELGLPLKCRGEECSVDELSIDDYDLAYVLVPVLDTDDIS